MGNKVWQTVRPQATSPERCMFQRQYDESSTPDSCIMVSFNQAEAASLVDVLISIQCLGSASLVILNK